jgi:hypothetical protein
MDVRPGALQRPHNLGSLVRRNSSGNAHYYAHKQDSIPAMTISRLLYRIAASQPKPRLRSLRPEGKNEVRNYDGEDRHAAVREHLYAAA